MDSIHDSWAAKPPQPKGTLSVAERMQIAECLKLLLDSSEIGFRAYISPDERKGIRELIKRCHGTN